MDYETLRYDQQDHVVTLTYDRPEQHNAVNRVMNRELHHAWQRFRDDDDAFVLVITGAGETTFCAGWDLQDAADLDRARRLRRVPGQPSQLARGVRLHAQGRHLQAGDRRRQRLRLRGWLGDGAARRHPHRRRERRVRGARAALEHRRRRWHDRAAAARRRLCQGDGADHHGATHRRGARHARSGSSTRSWRAARRCSARRSSRTRSLHCRRARSAPTRRASCAASDTRSRSGCGSRPSRRCRCSCAAIRTRSARAAFKAGNLSPEWPHHGL